VKTRINMVKAMQFAEQAGADLRKDRGHGRYSEFVLYEYTKLYHDYLVKRILKRVKAKGTT
jgi:hypothetical protein